MPFKETKFYSNFLNPKDNLFRIKTVINNLDTNIHRHMKSKCLTAHKYSETLVKIQHTKRECTYLPGAGKADEDMTMLLLLLDMG